jgi:hypothetical protein
LDFDFGDHLANHSLADTSLDGSPLTEAQLSSVGKPLASEVELFPPGADLFDANFVAGIGCDDDDDASVAAS